MKKTIAALLLAGALAMTACGGKTAETADQASPEEKGEDTAEEMPAEEEMETELENGILTVRVPHGSHGMDLEGFGWGLYEGDKGDASLTELIADSQEEGYDYVGSFRALEDAGDGEDYIRIAYKDGGITLAYLDVRVAVRDGAIREVTGTDGVKSGYEDAYIPFLEGMWAEENEGAASMTVSKGAEGCYEITLAKDTGRNGSVLLTTMHAWPDAAEGCLVYKDGSEQAAVISDSDDDTLQIGGGTMTGRIFPDSEDGAEPRLTWVDTDSGEAITFVKN